MMLACEDSDSIVLVTEMIKLPYKQCKASERICNFIFRLLAIFAPCQKGITRLHLDRFRSSVG